jgi:hypothetical protein
MQEGAKGRNRAMAALLAGGFAAALVFTGGSAFGAGKGKAIGKQCPKGTKGVHGACVREIAKHQHDPTTTTAAPTTTVAPAP